MNFYTGTSAMVIAEAENPHGVDSAAQSTSDYLDYLGPARTKPRRFSFPHILQSRTWREYAYLFVAMLLACFGLAYVLLVPSLTAALAITVVGLFVPAFLILGGRGWGTAWRGLAGTLLDEDITAPPRFQQPVGFWRNLGAMMGDITGWRALLFTFLAFPLSLVAFSVSSIFLFTGLGGLTLAIWGRFLPLQTMPNVECFQAGGFDACPQVRSFMNFSNWRLTSPDGVTQQLTGTSRYLDAEYGPHLVIAAIIGLLLLLLLWPLINRGFASLFRLLSQALLGRTATEVRIANLRATRAAAVVGADDRLRRIERDLHDGTQARLVAMSMQLGEARELLAAGADHSEVSALLDSAHSSSKEALTELRGIAQGIHPPALDKGLAVALETLAARSPVSVAVSLNDDEIAELEAASVLSKSDRSIVYYTVAELLTNVAKHSGAAHAGVVVEVERGTGRQKSLHVRVTDDGRGGAVVVRRLDGKNSGLAGLIDRLAAVDGTLEITSPTGGPTTVAVSLPLVG